MTETGTGTGTETETEMSKPGEILYRAFFDELRFAKQQQWAITNYTVLLMGGVFAVAKVISPATSGKVILCLIVFLIWGLNLFVLLDLQGYMQSVRRRQTAMEGTFSDEDQRLARGDQPSGTRRVFDSVYEFTRSHPLLAEFELFLVVLCLVVTVAMLIAGYAISQT
jgi:hypothetical protein